MAEVARACWCGADSLREFSPDYLRCTVCETLVGQAGLTDEETHVRNDEVDYYGKRYWLEHQRDALGLPDIYARARQDLPERCVHWLKTLLGYRRPPARILEVGAGHGAYTALLRWAGYDATALDLSAWVADFARKRFGVPYIVGPIEHQKRRRRSFDVVVANDVLEHLADPQAAMRRCVELIRPDGVIVIQTPEYRPESSYEELLAGQDPFLSHMQRAATEHLYLFSRKALELLFGRLGMGEVAFEDPIYPYDMLCVASAAPLERSEGDPSELVAAAKEAGPLLLALIDAHDAWQRSERDRADRLDTIGRLDGALRESEDDRKARLTVIEELDGLLKQSEKERQAQQKVIERLEAALEQSEVARTSG
jgi:2-polyprenyl-3-methyl-5-hydroxy-6-metoxy-1,4-benzoquinol methylase